MKRLARYSTAFIFAAAISLPCGAFAQGSSAGSGTKSGSSSSATDNAPRAGIGGAPENGSRDGQPTKSGASAVGNTSGSGTAGWTTRKGDPVAGESNPGDAARSQSETGSSGSR